MNYPLIYSRRMAPWIKSVRFPIQHVRVQTWLTSVVVLEDCVRKLLLPGLQQDLKTMELDAWMFERDPKLEK